MLGANRQLQLFVVPGYVHGNRIDVQQVADHPLTRCLWPGKPWGGIVGAPCPLENAEYIDFTELLVPDGPPCLARGTEIGNSTGMELRMHVNVLRPYDAPGLAIRLGFAPRNPRPKVATTIEHCDEVDSRWLVAFVRSKRRSRVQKTLERLTELLAHFDVRVNASSPEPDPLPAHLAECLGPSSRESLLLRVEGGEPDFAWQLAVLTYAAELSDVECSALHSVHIIDEIAGQPNFRRHWTSNQ
jgi:hypothetical protein